MKKELMEEILKERENLQEIRSLFKDKYVVVQLSPNIPGINKQVYPSEFLWYEGKKSLMKKLAIHEITIKGILDNTGALGNITWILVLNNPIYIKKICMELEQELLIGPYLDFDVFSINGKKISRTELGASSRKCFICNKYAKTCSFYQNHSLEKLIAKMKLDVEQYMLEM